MIQKWLPYAVVLPILAACAQIAAPSPASLLVNAQEEYVRDSADYVAWRKAGPHDQLTVAMIRRLNDEAYLALDRARHDPAAIDQAKYEVMVLSGYMRSKGVFGYASSGSSTH